MFVLQWLQYTDLTQWTQNGEMSAQKTQSVTTSKKKRVIIDESTSIFMDEEQLCGGVGNIQKSAQIKCQFLWDTISVVWYKMTSGYGLNRSTQYSLFANIQLVEYNGG